MSIRRFTRLDDISLATRLSLVALLVTLVSLSITATVGLARGNALADDLADDRLVAAAATRSESVRLYVGSVRQQVVALAASPATRAAISALGDASAELGDESIADATDRLTQYYLSEVVPELGATDESTGASLLVPDQSAAVLLQNAYTVPAEDDDGRTIDPILVADAADGSEYSRIHARVHRTIGEVGLRSGFDDIFLIDARGDTIVYSLRKRIDFGTSLDVGPHSGSALARLVDSMPASTPSTISDFAIYRPALDRPIAFVASPVVDGSTVVGYLAVALSIDPFDRLLSGNGSWDGFGETGETYLVGEDGIVRSTLRPYQESPSSYLARASEPGPAELTEAQRRRIRANETTALVQPTGRSVPERADGGPGLVESTNYRGVAVRTAYAPVAIDDLGWTVFVEVTRDELDGPIEDYARGMLFAVALFVVTVTFVAVRWSDRVMAPIRDIATRLRTVRNDPADLEDTPDRTRHTDYGGLSDNVDLTIERLRERRRSVADRSAERSALLHEFLPAAAARRSEDGTVDLLDHARSASVVVLAFDGLDLPRATGPALAYRHTLTELVDELDALAADLGLERIAATGSGYTAVCGVSRPFLDHAPRSVEFALAACDLVGEVGTGGIRVRAAVASGAVSVGAVARDALVYDAWGDTVQHAGELLAGAPWDAVLVASSTREQLPTDFVAGETSAITGAAIVTRRIEDSEPVA